MNKNSNLNLVAAILVFLACAFNIMLAYNNYAISKNNGVILHNNELIFEQLTKQIQMNDLTNCHTDIYKFDQNNTFYLVQSSDYVIVIKGWNQEDYIIGTERFKFHKVCK